MKKQREVVFFRQNQLGAWDAYLGQWASGASRLAHTYESAFVECLLKQSVSCHNPDHIRLWLQRVRGHLGVRLRVHPRPEDSHWDLSQILPILLDGIRRWHTDLRILSKVMVCTCRARTVFLCKVQCQLRFTEAPARYDHRVHSSTSRSF